MRSLWVSIFTVAVAIHGAAGVDWLSDALPRLLSSETTEPYCDPPHNHNSVVCEVSNSTNATTLAVAADHGGTDRSPHVDDTDTCGYVDAHSHSVDTSLVLKLSRTSASLSIIGGVFMLFTYAFLPEMRAPQTQVVLQLAIANLLSSIATLIEPDEALFNATTCCPTAVCLVQASLSTFADLAAVFWSACIAMQVSLRMVFVPDWCRAAQLCMHCFMSPLTLCMLDFLYSVSVRCCFILERSTAKL